MNKFIIVFILLISSYSFAQIGGGGSNGGSANGVQQITAGTNVTITPTNGKGNVTVNATGGTTTSPGNAGTNYFYGDSTVSVAGTGDYGSAKQLGARLCNDMLGQCQVNAVVGRYTSAISADVFQTFNVTYGINSNTPKVIIDAGINNAANETVTTGSINNYSLEYNAMVAWIDIPTINKVYASTGTAAGTWTSVNTLPLDASNVGTGRFSETNGSTLTFNIPTGGTRSGLTYAVLSTANGGTFTYAIDGVLQTDVCSGTTTFADTGCNGIAVANSNTFFRQEFTVTAGTHTGVVTVTSSTSSANLVLLLDADISPTSLVGQPIILASGVIKQFSDSDSIATAAFDAAQDAVVTSLSSWANVYRVDVRTGTPGVNSTTDMVVNNPLCPGGNQPLHPNSCGYLHWVQTFENTANALNADIFYPGLGVNPQTSIGPFNAYGPITSGEIPTTDTPFLGSFQVATSAANTSILGATSNILNNAIPSATLFAQPLCFFNPATAISCEGFTYDAVRAQLATGFMSQYEMGFLHCPANVTGGPTNCRWDLYSDPVTGSISTPSGFNGRARGIATLVAGTVTVTTTFAATPSATTTYSLTNCGLNGSIAIGTLSVGTVSVGTSFVINSLTAISALAVDTSIVCWQIN